MFPRKISGHILQLSMLTTGSRQIRQYGATVAIRHSTLSLHLHTHTHKSSLGTVSRDGRPLFVHDSNPLPRLTDKQAKTFSNYFLFRRPDIRSQRCLRDVQHFEEIDSAVGFPLRSFLKIRISKKIEVKKSRDTLPFKWSALRDWLYCTLHERYAPTHF